jgi:hypothetical protein
MCFQIIAKGYAREPFALSDCGALKFGVRKHWFDKRISVHISETGCACSLLSDAADWNAPLWSLREEILPGLATALKLLHDNFEGGFNLEALWISDTVSLDELVSLIRENSLANFTRYIVQ